MIYILITISVLIIILGLISTRDNIFSPSVITAAIWFLCLLLYLFLPHGLPPLANKVFVALLLWLVLLSLSSLFIQPIVIKRQTSDVQASKLVRDIYLVISVIAFFGLIFWVKSVLNNGFVGDWAEDLRMTAIGKDKNIKAFGGLHVILWQISLLLELLYFKKRNWYRLLIPIICCLCFGFFTMSKSDLLCIFIMCVCVLFFKKVVKPLHVFVGLAILFVGFMSLQAIRQQKESKSDDFLTLYLVSSMYGLESVKPASAEHFGENTFRFYYAIANKTGLSDTKPVKTILKFIEKPITTNTYTAIYPFYKDFGLFGLITVAIIFGLFYGWLFVRAKIGSAFFIATYAYFMHALIMQFANDMVITNIAGNLKFVVLLAIPFLAEKYKMFYYNSPIVQNRNFGSVLN